MPNTCVGAKLQEIRSSFKIMPICRIPHRVFVSTNATFLEKDHVRNHQPRSKLVLSEISKEATDKTTRGRRRDDGRRVVIKRVIRETMTAIVQ